MAREAEQLEEEKVTAAAASAVGDGSPCWSRNQGNQPCDKRLSCTMRSTMAVAVERPKSSRRMMMLQELKFQVVAGDLEVDAELQGANQQLRSAR